MLGEIDTGDPKVVKYNPERSRSIPITTQSNYYIENPINPYDVCASLQGLSREAWREQNCQRSSSQHQRKSQKLCTSNASMGGNFVKKYSSNESCSKLNESSAVNSECQIINISQSLTRLHLYFDVKKPLLGPFIESPTKSSQRFRVLRDSKGTSRNRNKRKKRRRRRRRSSIDGEEDHHRVEENTWLVSSNETTSVECDLKDNFKKSETWQRTKIPSARRFYLQLAFLLFLIAFGGHSGVGIGVRVPRSSVLGIITVGTMFGVATKAAPIDIDAAIRAERSANLSHLTGTSRKILMFIKNRFLQILPDGTVNGTETDNADYTIFQRISVSSGQLKIQGVATCLYLCMDSCGLLYGSREYTEDCVFNETLEAHNYNTYSSVRWSTPRKTLYMGLNRYGQPRRVQARGHNLGRLSPYARVLTLVASPDRLETLQNRILGAQHRVRHHHVQHHQNIQQSICSSSLSNQEKDSRDRFRCRKRKKRKKRRRRCEKNEKMNSHCETRVEEDSKRCSDTGGNVESSVESKRSCEDVASDELSRKQNLNTPAVKRKSRLEVVKNDERSHSKKKDSKKKLTRKVSLVDGVDNTADMKQKGLIFKENSSLVKKKFPGRSIRTTVPAPTENSSATLATWFFGPTTQSSWDPSTRYKPPKKTVNQTMKLTSPKKMETQVISTPSSYDKIIRTSNVPSVIVEFSTENTSLLSPTFESSDDIFIPTSTTSDISEETSEEDFGLDDDPTGTSSDYGLMMTTMDTTSPERTENYAKTTTQSLMESLEINRPVIDSNRSSVDSTFPFKRLAM
ncbi:uncharacterized protein bnl [Chelonus insularis]|uniref:uncharacterized protein bnl n=1 Tax=Chelonus insularis TaxID=460826 RepID=UPI001589AA4D|nr:uncharacterized protein LOC118071517 [Chelonus insularis]XP_034946699.1 uncharacterized protein LOC118071517 [Chelonus insularis]XP_034946784.1 uncharacterized protein LOC118071517 [Chelonus insularis]